MSSSLRRPKNKDQHQQQHRSGTLDRRSINRSHSIAAGSGRKFRDRDLNVKYSRGVQTRLTKDPALEDQQDGEVSALYYYYSEIS